MSAFDVAVGLQAGVLTQGAAQLYSDPQARQKLFSGTRTGTLAGLEYRATWDIQAAPTFTLAPPDAVHWAAAVTADGGNPPAGSSPPPGTFQLVAPTLAVGFQAGTEPALRASAEVRIYGSVGVAQDPRTRSYEARLAPVAVWLDESKMSNWDRAIVNLIIASLLTAAQSMLSGWSIPALTFSKEVDGVSISVALAEPPVVAIDQGRLIVAAALQSRGKPADITGARWPEQALFALVSPGVLQEVVGQVSAQLHGREKQGSGSYKSLLSYEYSATVQGLTVTQDPADMTRLTAALQATFSATLKPLGIGGPCAVSAAGSAL